MTLKYFPATPSSDRLFAPLKTETVSTVQSERKFRVYIKNNKLNRCEAHSDLLAQASRAAKRYKPNSFKMNCFQKRTESLPGFGPQFHVDSSIIPPSDFDESFCCCRNSVSCSTCINIDNRDISKKHSSGLMIAQDFFAADANADFLIQWTGHANVQENRLQRSHNCLCKVFQNDKSG
jgi:hypothetical protein